MNAVHAPPPPPPVATSEASTPALLSEARQQNTEVRLTLSKVSDKVDRMMEKVGLLSLLICIMYLVFQVEQMHQHQLMPNLAVNMETTALMHNIQRIVQVGYFTLPNPVHVAMLCNDCRKMKD
jgi:FK506-binding protein 15